MGSDDDGIGSGSEDELFLAEKDWKKLNVKSAREGFREGISQASEDSLQAGFDAGYAKSFQTGLLLGKLRGKIAAKKLILGDVPETISVKIELIEEELNKYEEECKSEDVMHIDLQNKLTELEA